MRKDMLRLMQKKIDAYCEKHDIDKSNSSLEYKRLMTLALRSYYNMPVRKRAAWSLEQIVIQKL